MKPKVIKYAGSDAVVTVTQSLYIYDEDTALGVSRLHRQIWTNTKEWLLVREDEAVRHLHFVRLIQWERWAGIAGLGARPSASMSIPRSKAKEMTMVMNFTD
ncbi:hypothetical protein IFM47457_03155 [Aspergillus lentulus]|nr:hypothetical protein IFM47457_03155 [Aspergillus lentulus]